ncbi:MoaD/ThiS family protein [Streptomonospora litoralis]|uniref:Sulfur carrier protein CysO n=1 Tax=Streptomonospora litoralis TaxID=2498135 RepID=A0A4P6Q566_9ACTN|nr:Sulfur carrier protein CysO [Streptomonospora litoralis]
MAVTVVLPQVLQSDAGGAARIEIMLAEAAPTPPTAATAPDASAPAGGPVPAAAPAAAAAPDTRATLRALLDELARRHPGLDRRIRDEQGRLRRYVNVFVDSDECRAVDGLDTPVPEGAEVRILPSVAGG